MLRDVQAAFDELEHPDRFSGGGSTGVEGCSTFLLNVTFEDAAAHYRDALPAAGWHVTVDDDSRLEARRDGLVFVIANDRRGSGMVAAAGLSSRLIRCRPRRSGMGCVALRPDLVRLVHEQAPRRPGGTHADLADVATPGLALAGNKRSM